MKPPKLVAVLNVTPDSFSDGGEIAPDHVLERASQLIEEGANVLDVGAESTRPDAIPLTSQQEWSRLEPVWESLAALCKENDVLLSLDSYHPETVCRALDISCDWANDVRGFTDQAMLDAVRNAGCKLVVMHSLTIPADKKIVLPETCDVVEEVQRWIDRKMESLINSDIAVERVILDPGIGFGKTAQQSFELLMRAPELDLHGAKLFLGHSRKSFMALFDESLEPHERDTLTRAFSAMLAHQQVDYLRVHDVAGHRKMFSAL